MTTPNHVSAAVSSNPNFQSDFALCTDGKKRFGANVNLTTSASSSTIGASNVIPAVTFHRFKELKPKVQQLIWQFASQIPALIVTERIYLNDEITVAVESTSDPLRSVCRYSRSESLKYRQTILNGGNSYIYNCPGFFTNPDVDTILFTLAPYELMKRVDKDMSLDVLAEADSYGNYTIGELWSLRILSWRNAIEFPIAARYAMSYLSWFEEVYPRGFYNMCDHMHSQQIKGLTLVVGLEQHDLEGGTKLIEPRGTPRTMLKPEFLLMNNVSVQEHITWKGMEQKVRVQVEQYIANRPAEKLAFYADPSNAGQQYSDLSGEDDACDAWMFHHQIRFLEAVALDVNVPSAL